MSQMMEAMRIRQGRSKEVGIMRGSGFTQFRRFSFVTGEAGGLVSVVIWLLTTRERAVDLNCGKLST